MVLLFTLLSNYIKGCSFTSIVKIISVFALSFILGGLVYKLFIMEPVIDGLVSTSFAPLVDFPSIFIEHMRKYFYLISSFVRRSWKNYVFIVFIVFLLLMLLILNIVNLFLLLCPYVLFSSLLFLHMVSMLV